MTFTVSRKSLLAELALLQSVLESKLTMPVLAYVKFDLANTTLTLTATNLDMSITTQIEAQGEAWSGCLPSAQLYALVKLLADETIAFEQKDGRMEVKAGRARHKLPVRAETEFPQIERLNVEGLTLNLALSNQMITATAFSALPFVDHLKPSDIKYTGLSLRVLDGKLEAMATNLKMAAIAEASSELQSFAVILPRQAVTALQRLEGETVTMKHSENLVEFISGQRSIIARQLMGQFPQWRMFVPELPLSSSVSTSELQSAIKRAAVTMGTDNAVGYEEMRATFAKESVLIETRGGDKGKSEELIEAQSNLNGDALSIGFINSQVLDVLSKCGENVTCHLSDGEKPMVFKPKVGEFESTFIVMPVSLRAW
jgi:DNA polymerase-3 subunit beta